MTKHVKTIRPYRKQKVLFSEFNLEAERVTKQYGLLVGIDRLSGFVDTLGTAWSPAWSLHVNGVCFRVESIPAATAFLKGWICGRDFLESSLGRRGITENECRDLVNHIVSSFMSKHTGAGRAPGDPLAGPAQSGL